MAVQTSRNQLQMCVAKKEFFSNYSQFTIVSHRSKQIQIIFWNVFLSSYSFAPRITKRVSHKMDENNETVFVLLIGSIFEQSCLRLRSIKNSIIFIKFFRIWGLICILTTGPPIFEVIDSLTVKATFEQNNTDYKKSAYMPYLKHRVLMTSFSIKIVLIKTSQNSMLWYAKDDSSILKHRNMIGHL